MPASVLLLLLLGAVAMPASEPLCMGLCWPARPLPLSGGGFVTEMCPRREDISANISANMPQVRPSCQGGHTGRQVGEGLVS